MTSNASTSVFAFATEKCASKVSTWTSGFSASMRACAGFELRSADVGGAVDDLPLEVAEVDGVEVDEAERADAGRGEIERRRRSEPAGADAQHARRLQPPLPFLADFGQQQVTAVALAARSSVRAADRHGLTRRGCSGSRLADTRILSVELRTFRLNFVSVSLSLILLALLAAAAAAAVAWTIAAERRAADLRRALTATERELNAARATLAAAQQAQAGLRGRARRRAAERRGKARGARAGPRRD